MTKRIYRSAGSGDMVVYKHGCVNHAPKGQKH